MTRINLVPPRELTDQHLFAEFRELKMVPRALARSLETLSKDEVLSRIPPTYRLGTGHVLFFYDKGAYLYRRYSLVRKELDRRGNVDYDRKAKLDLLGVFEDDDFFNSWTPKEEDFRLIRKRIKQRILMKPSWYRYFGVSLPESDYPLKSKLKLR